MLARAACSSTEPHFRIVVHPGRRPRRRTARALHRAAAAALRVLACAASGKATCDRDLPDDPDRSHLRGGTDAIDRELRAAVGPRRTPSTLRRRSRTSSCAAARSCTATSRSRLLRRTSIGHAVAREDTTSRRTAAVRGWRSRDGAGTGARDVDSDALGDRDACCSTSCSRRAGRVRPGRDDMVSPVVSRLARRGCSFMKTTTTIHLTHALRIFHATIPTSPFSPRARRRRSPRRRFRQPRTPRVCRMASRPGRRVGP